MMAAHPTCKSPRCICGQAIPYWREVDASLTADRRRGKVTLKSWGTACTRRKACKNRPTLLPSACWLFECLSRTERTVSAETVGLFHDGELGSIPQELLARARDFRHLKASRSWKFVYRLNTGLSRLSAEKQRENFYKFSAVVYKLTTVSTG